MAHALNSCVPRRQSCRRLSALGFAGAFLVSRVLSSLTNQLAETFASSTHDPLLLFGAPLLLAAIAMLACYLPARRSARVDPLTALRDE